MTKAERLFALLGETDNDLLEEAAQPVFPVPAKRHHWGRWGALCACLLLVFFLPRLMPRMGSSGNTAPGEMPPNALEPTLSAPPESAEPGAAPDGDYGGGADPSAPAGGSTLYGTAMASVISPITGEAIELFCSTDRESLLLRCGEQEISLPVPSDVRSEWKENDDISELVDLVTNGCLEGEFEPRDHVSYENYVLIVFGTAPGQSVCLIVGINADGSFVTDGTVYFMPTE